MNCFDQGRLLGRAQERLRSAGGSIAEGDLLSAEHNVRLTKLDLEQMSRILGPYTSKRIAALLEDPLEAIRKARRTIQRKKLGRVSRRRLYPAMDAIQKAMHRASNKCS